VPPSAERTVGAFWQGTLDGKLGVSITVFGEGKDAIGGLVRYDNALSMNRIKLEGRTQADGRFDWRERESGLDAGGNPVDRDGGRYTGAISSDGKTASGQWQSADGAQTLPFTLTRSAQYRELTMPRVNGTNATLIERYPVTGEPAVDALVHTLRLPVCGESDLECRSGIELAWLGPERVSLLRTYWFFSGGAHGNSDFVAGNWRKTPNGYERVTLADLIEPSASCREKFNALLVASLKRQGASDAGRGALDEKTLRSTGLPFTLHRKGVVVHYAPYAVGPYAQGAFQVPATFEQLGACRRGKAST
jgi:hypothetical protein